MTLHSFRHERQQCRSQARAGLTLVELLVVIGIVGVLVALALPAVLAARDSGRRTTCAKNQFTLAYAVIQHDQRNGFIPGWRNLSPNPIYRSPQPVAETRSWPLPLLPFLERADVYAEWVTQKCDVEAGVIDNRLGWGNSTSKTGEFSSSNDWNQNGRIDPARPLLSVFICPAYPPKLPPGEDQPRLSYAANAGSCAGDNRFKADGVLLDTTLSDGKRDMEDISNADGIANVLLLADRCSEMMDPCYPHWAFPMAANTFASTTCFRGVAGSYNDPALPPVFGIRGRLTAGPPNQCINPQSADATSGAAPNMVATPGYFSLPNSQHAGGVMAAFCDGHTAFLTDSLAASVYAQLVTADHSRQSTGSIVPMANAAAWNPKQPLQAGDY